MIKYFKIYRKDSPKNAMYYAGYSARPKIFTCTAGLVIEQVSDVPADQFIQDGDLSPTDRKIIADRNAPILDAMESSLGYDGSTGIGEKPPAACPTVNGVFSSFQ